MSQNISFMKMKLMEEFEEGNAFTKMLAKTKKGGEFKVGGKSFKDTSNYDDPSVKEEMLCKECGGMMESGKCSSCGYMEESNLYGDPDHRFGVDDGQPEDEDAAAAASAADAADGADGGIGESLDHEVSMAKSSLQDIVSNASQLMNKIGDKEIDLPAWIQDHITNAANYIDQANTGYYEYGTGGEETPDDEAPMMEEISLQKVQAADSAIANLISNISTNSNIPTTDKEGLLSALREIQEFIDEVGHDVELGDNEEFEEGSSLTTMMEAILKEKAGLDKMGYTKNAQAAGPYRGGIGMGAGLEEKKKPSAGLSKKQKSSIVKKAKKGGDIGKKGKGFADVVKAAKAGGARDPQAVAAAAMWKGAAKRAHK